MPQQSTMLRIISKICGEGGAGGQGGQHPETRGGALSRRPARPTHHDHSHHDGGDADEVQLPREELVDLPVAVLLRGRPESSQRCPSSAPREAAAQGHCRRSTEGHSPAPQDPSAEV